MHFLFIRTKKAVYDIPWALIELGHKVDMLEDFEFDPLNEEEKAGLALQQKLSDALVDFVISYLFIPQVSNICEGAGLDYISWTYDSPLTALFDASICNSHNYTFIFDRCEYEHLKKRGIPHIYHLPLGANISRTGALNITPEDELNYAKDISFIGSLYEDNSYNTFIHLFPEHLALDMKTYLMTNLCRWNEVKPWPRTSPAVTEFITNELQGSNWNRFDMDDALYYGMLILTRKLAEMDRITVLNALAEHHSVELYTNSNPRHLAGVHMHQGVDYYTDMNKIFYLSKINLNITLPSIETGLPQRIFDIMGSGGFVLTNYQKEIDDLFVVGKEIEVFHDLPELLEKADYYLTHETERLKIAINGYIKVRDYHTYPHRINEMLHTIDQQKASEKEEA